MSPLHPLVRRFPPQGYKHVWTPDIYSKVREEEPHTTDGHPGPHRVSVSKSGDKCRLWEATFVG